MGWEFDTNDFDPETLGGFDNPKPGRYHVQVQQCDESGGKKGEMTVRFEVLAGTVPDQEGKTHLEYFSKTPAAAKRALMFAVACGLTTIDELKQCKGAGKNPVIHFSDAVGRQLCIGLEEDEYEGKKRNKVDFRIWATDAPEAKDIPKNAGMLAANGTAAGGDPFAGLDNF
jgi:hypothetical protein